MMAGNFIKQIERARAATQPSRPAEKPLDRMTQAELDEALRLAKVEVVEANRAVAQAVADDRNQPPATTLAGKLRDLQRSKRKTWR
jgi:hypothetical protein